MSLQNISTLYLVLFQKKILSVGNKRTQLPQNKAFTGIGPEVCSYQLDILGSDGCSGTRQTKFL